MDTNAKATIPVSRFSDPTRETPNPVVATCAASDGGTIRIYASGLVDGIDGRLYSISPGFDSVDAFEDWLREETERSERDERVREAADAYGENRDGSMLDAGGWLRKTPGPTALAIRTLEHVHAAHMRGDGLELSHIGAAVLWAEIMRRSSAGDALDVETDLAQRADARRGGRA